MDLSCIISSGDLELYVLGMLPEEEARQVEQLAALFPEVRQEVDRISEALEAVANDSTLAPGAATRDRMFHTFSQLKEEPDTIDTESIEPTTREEVPNYTADKVVPLNGRKTNYLAAASLIGLAVCLALIAYLVNNNRQNHDTIASLERKLDTTHQTLSQMQQKSLAYDQFLKMMQDENYKEVKLQNVPGKPKAMVSVFWNKATTEVMLVNVSLPQTPPRKQYQLWAIVDGKPVSAGMLEPNNITAQKMQSFAKAEAFAITLEKSGGSATPTMEQLYVMGKTS